MTSPEYSKLLGIPYAKRDCWGIVVDFYKLAFNLELKEYYSHIPESPESAKNLVFAHMKDFYQVEEKDRKFGDIILIKLMGVECHIGVYIGDDRILHTTNHSGCVIDRALRWKHLIVGYYRIKDDSAS